MSSYHETTQVAIGCNILDIDGDLIDPTGLSVTIQPGPGHADQTFTYVSSGTGGWTRLGVGQYRYIVDTTGGNGQFTCEWAGSGNVKVLGVWIFNVVPRPLS